MKSFLQYKKMIYLIILFIIISSNSAFSQNFDEFFNNLENNEKPNLYEMQKQFYKYWEGKDSTKKGIGWKQFKRYEDFWLPRVYPNGDFPNPDILVESWNDSKLRNAKNKINQKNNINTWEHKGPTSSNGGYAGLGRISVVKAAPNDTNTIWVGSASGGLWKTTNGGTTWNTNTDNLEIMPTLGVNDILFDNNDPSLMYIATGDHVGNTYSIGLLKSTDGGISWATTGLNFSRTSTRIIYNLDMHPTNSNIIYASTSNGIMKTTDGGINWTNIKSGGHRVVKINSSNPDILYAVNNSTFFRSTDAGSTWTTITSGLPTTNLNRIAMEYAPSNPSTVYLLVSSSQNNFRGLYRSTDSGISWTTQSTTPNILGYEKNGSGTGGQGWYDLCIAVHPQNENIVTIGGVNLWQSTNAGVNWTNKSFWYNSPPTPEVHADQHYIGYMNNSTSTLLSGNDGGVYRSRNNGDSWSYIGSGIAVTQFYRIGVSNINPNYIIAGTQDNGTKIMKNSVWSDVIGGDGMDCLIKDDNPNTMYGSLYYGAIFRSDNAGVNFTKINDLDNNGNYDQINETGGWVTPFLTDPNNPDHLYVGMKHVWKSTNNGNTFVKLSNGWGTNNLSILQIAPSNSNYIIASKGDNFRFSTDGGVTWGTKTKPSGQWITNFKFHPNNHNIVYATCSGYSASEKVYVSNDFGDTWTNITYNLINVPINNSIYQDANNAQRLFIATDLGVYVLKNNSTTWEAFNDGLPQVVVRELEIQESDTLLVAGTYGRGIWSIDLKGTLVLAKPTLIYPANNDVNIALKNIGFNWNKVKNAQMYQVQVSLNTNFNINELDFTVMDSIGFRDLSINYGNYNWRVRAINGNVFSEWSDVFKLRSMVGTPNISLPLNNSKYITQKDSTKWSNVQFANTYQIQISTDEMFNTIILDKEKGSTLEILSILDFYKDYYIRVRARSADGLGLWSDVVKFKTIFNKPILLTPADLSIKLDTNITFQWSKVDGATGYRINIYRENLTNLTSVLSQVFNSNSINQFKFNHNYETKYHWRVIAKDGDIEMISDTFEFETRIQQPNLTFPLNNRVMGNTNINFAITDNKFNDNKKFEIEIIKDDNGIKKVLKTVISDQLTTPINLKTEIESLLAENEKICFEWRARAIKIETQDTSDWSDYGSFCYTLPQITLVTPLENQDNITTPQFRFRGSEGFTTYTLVFYKGTLEDKNRNVINVNFTNMVDGEYIISSLSNSSDPCTKYIWRVIGISGTDSVFSEYRTYYTVDTKVQTLTPNQNIVFKKNNFEFNWNKNPNFSNYEILISLDNFQTILKTELTKDTFYVLKNVNIIDELVFWKVRAYKIEDNITYACDWSNIVENRFYSIYSPPKLILPLKNEVLTDRKVKFEWTKLELADDYELHIIADNFNQKYSTIDTNYSVTFPETVKDFKWKLIAKTMNGNSQGQSEDSELRDNKFDSGNSIDDFGEIITIYPNPAKDILYITGLEDIKSFGTNSNVINIEIFDLLSKLHFEQKYELNSSSVSNSISINIHELPRGSYNIKIKYGEQLINKMFIKN